ncbi:hypothetical protein BDP27DRAFT_1365978 [Rhodocollybia butyracea]|uniref:Uncharacterized protein n=1 Tax=Rhodocollybia butyracea TaxID=206335 RepID=A0A9P5U4K2_9AGAR|nr:hypothetical protein BDP27DRAFT_1365978 [Rhodocollybia butyracea]
MRGPRKSSGTSNVQSGLDSAKNEAIVKYMPGRPHAMAFAELTGTIIGDLMIANGEGLSRSIVTWGAAGGRVPEMYGMLKMDMEWWLENGDVNLVILVVIQRKQPQMAVQRGQRVDYYRPIPGSGVAESQNVEPLHIRYTDFDIAGLQGELVLPMEASTEAMWWSME